MPTTKERLADELANVRRPPDNAIQWPDEYAPIRQSPSPVKSCINCKWAAIRRESPSWWPWAPKLAVWYCRYWRDRVTGLPSVCASARRYDGDCGADGSAFEDRARGFQTEGQ